jgi:hypothetical protein
VGTVHGDQVIAHDGQLRDFDTAMAILPRDKVSVVVLMNEDPQIVLNDEQLYDGVMQGITTGSFPPVAHTFIIFYAVFDTIVLVSLILMIWSLCRTRTWLRKRQRRTSAWRAAITVTGVDLGMAALISVGVVYGLGAVTGQVPLTPTLMIFAAPDVTVWIGAIVAFFVARAAIRTVAITVTRHAFREDTIAAPAYREAQPASGPGTP